MILFREDHMIVSPMNQIVKYFHRYYNEDRCQKNVGRYVMNKRMLSLLVSAVLAGSVFGVPATAEETTTDYSYLEDMSVKELKELDAAIHDIIGGTVSYEKNTEAETEPESELSTEVAVLMDEQEFLDDIVASYNARSIEADRYSNAELNTMSNDEFIQYYANLVEQERWLYEKYKNAIFEDLNIQYLCQTYCAGVKSQIECCEKYQDDHDYDKCTNSWTAAFNKRSYVIVELADYYNLPFGDVSDMRENTKYLDSLNEAETRNSQVDTETVKKAQQLLDDIGFKGSAVDGVAGKKTVKSIKRFQEMYGYSPVDGMIDDELITQLEQVKEEKGLFEEESETME